MYKIAKNFPQLQFESNTTMMAKYYPQKNHIHNSILFLASTIFFPTNPNPTPKIDHRSIRFAQKCHMKPLDMVAYKSFLLSLPLFLAQKLTILKNINLFYRRDHLKKPVNKYIMCYSKLFCKKRWTFYHALNPPFLYIHLLIPTIHLSLYFLVCKFLIIICQIQKT